jgi:nucleoid-associated protein YgaU
MQRYEKYANIIKTETQRKRRYSTMYYPSIERKTSDIYIITRNNDRLDLLANNYYGDPRLWVILAKANKLHAGTLRIPAGSRLRIPYPLDRGDVFKQFTDKQF